MNNYKYTCFGTMALSLVCIGLFANAAEIVSPKDGEAVVLLPSEQKQIMSVPTLKERLEIFDLDRKNGKKLRHSKGWRKSMPLVLKWKCNVDEKGPWEVRVGTKPDLSDARIEVYSKTSSNIKTNADMTVQCTIYRANLEIGRDYYWRVTSNVSCGKFGHIRGKCECTGIKETVSEIATFRTEDMAPRWIEIEGNVSNMRDLGGRKAMRGCRVRQGMAYRGQGLNNNSQTGERPGRNRLTVEDVKLLTGNLGIRTDLDLRTSGETAGMTVSPLGKDIKFVHRSSQAYKGIFSEDGKKVMAANFRLFCDKANYPIYFHCIGGADRTGSLAYVLNGVLGVDRHELETDWESTFYPRIPDSNPDKNFWCRESHFNDGFGKYGKEGDSWNRRIELYLLDCGVTEAEIETFRSIMLESVK